MKDEVIYGKKQNGVTKIGVGLYEFRFRKTNVASRLGKNYSKMETIKNSNGKKSAIREFNRWYEARLLEYEKEQTAYKNRTLIKKTKITFWDIAKSDGKWANYVRQEEKMKLNTLENHLENLRRIHEGSDKYPDNKWFTNRNIQDISAVDCEELKAQIMNRGVSLQTVSKYLNGINQIFEYAKKQLKLIKSNPMIDLQVSAQSKPKLKNILRREEFFIVLEEIKKLPENLSLYFQVAMYSGLRRGELCGLEWDKILWDEQVIDISQTYVQGKLYECGYHFKNVTKNSTTRYIPLFESAKKALAESECYQKQPLWTDKDGIIRNLVFCKENGSPYRLSYYSHKWEDFVKELKEQKLISKTPSLHDLRKSFITHTIRDIGMPLETVSMIAGHKKTSTTEQYYLDRDKSDMAKVAQKYAI